jgi:hypothetical protein
MISQFVCQLHDVSLGAVNQTEHERPVLVPIPPRGRRVTCCLLPIKPLTLWLQPLND